MHLPYGSLEPPLGPSRLRIVELLSLLVKKGGSVSDWKEKFAFIYVTSTKCLPKHEFSEISKIQPC